MRERGLSQQILGEIMERAVPLDPIGDQRIDELLSQLREERSRRGHKRAERDARHN